MDSCFSGFNPREPTPSEGAASSSQGELTAREISIVIRRARSQDLNDLADVLARSFHPPLGMMAWVYPLLKLGIQEDLRSRLQEGSAQYLCLTAAISGTRSRPGAPGGAIAISPLPEVPNREDRIAGTVELAVRSPIFPGCPHYAYISNLAVSPFYRRQGIGRKLLLGCEPTARAWGFREIYLHVLEDNERARKLYLNSGYRLHRTESSWFGSWLNQPRRLLLHKPLG